MPVKYEVNILEQDLLYPIYGFWFTKHTSCKNMEEIKSSSQYSEWISNI